MTIGLDCCKQKCCATVRHGALNCNM